MIPASERPFVHPEQLSLLAGDPQPGERWRSTMTGRQVAVIDVVRRRYTWVTIRSGGLPQTIRLDNFTRAFERI